MVRKWPGASRSFPLGPARVHDDICRGVGEAVESGAVGSVRIPYGLQLSIASLVLQGNSHEVGVGLSESIVQPVDDPHEQ
jgi:hypothetical protein